MTKWTTERDETLLKLKQKRLSYLDIGDIMGETTDALRNRYYILTHQDKTFEEFESEARILVYDIETSLMLFSGFRTGRVHYIGKYQLLSDYYVVSWSAKWLGEEEVFGEVQKPSEAKRGKDKRILKPMWKLMNEADILVGHNVDRFDTRRLNTRFVLNGMPLPSKSKSIDTLKVARKTFDFSYNDLDYICKAFGIEGKRHNDGYEMWERCRMGDKQALEDMLMYNMDDVRATERLYNHLKYGLYSPPKPARGGWKADRIKA